MTPEWGSRSSDLPPETQFVLAQLRSVNPNPTSPPTFVCLVPLIDAGAFRATLRPPSSDPSSSSSSPPPSDDLCLRIESGSPLVKAASFENALLVAAGTDPLALADAAVVAAAALSGAARPRTSKTVPDFVDLFGWCTWDAFYSSVSARGVADGLESLREAGAPPPGFLIIDDGWQVTTLDAGPLLEHHHASADPVEAARADAELGVLLQGAAAQDAAGGAESGLLGPLANAAAVEALVEKEAAEAAAAEAGEEGGGAATIHHRAALAHLPPAAAAAPPTPAPRPPSRARALAATASGWARGKGELALASLYGRLVERAPAGSAGHRAFGALVASGDPGAWRGRLGSASEAGGEEAERKGKGEKEKKKEKKKKDGALRPALLDFYAASSDHVRRLASFRANEKFSRPGAGPGEPMRPGPRDGLASVVTDVRERFGVRRVLAWHALHGYWGGVAPGGGAGGGGFFAADAAEDAAEDAAAGGGEPGCSTALVWPVPTPGVLDVDPPYAWSPQCLSGVGLARDPAALFRGLHGYEERWTSAHILFCFFSPFSFSPLAPFFVLLLEERKKEQQTHPLSLCLPPPPPPSNDYKTTTIIKIRYLKASGIDGVKVDAQATLGMIGGGAVPAPCAGSTARAGAPSASSPMSSPSSRADLALVGGPSLSASYHAALEASIAHHFPGNAAINCMCHSTEDVFNFSHSAVARSSDDFWPRDPASHRAHVAVNAFNSVFFSPLVQPDWDMFHSRHPAARLHALARVVSGGPVYVSDAPGAHDGALLRRLALPDGRVLRPAAPGKPTADCLFADVMRDGRSLLKVSTVNGTTVAVGAPGGEETGKKEEEEEEEEEEETEAEGSAAAAAATAGAAAGKAGGAFSCGLVAVFNTQSAAWSRRTRRFELLETGNGGSGAAAGCAPSSAGVASWLKSKLLPLCGGGGGSEKKRTESEDEAEADAEVLSTTVSPFDVAPRLRIPPSGAFIAWSDEQQTATLLIAPPPPSRKKRSDGSAAAGGGSQSCLTVSLPRGGADLISFSPVLLLLEGKSAATLVRAAVVGLTRMVNAGGAVLSVAQSASPRSVSVVLRGSGELTLWSEAAPASATVDGTKIESSAVSWDAASRLARVQVPGRAAAKEGGGFEPDAEVLVFF